MLLEIVRELSGVANRACEYICSNPCSFGDMTFFRIFSKIFKKNLDVEKFKNLEDLNPVVGICEGTLRGLRNLPLNMLLKSLYFSINDNF